MDQEMSPAPRYGLIAGNGTLANNAVINSSGGTLGGALIKDRLFYFLSGEVTRREFPLISSMTRPPLFDGNGKFVGACTASAAQCETALL